MGGTLTSSDWISNRKSCVDNWPRAAMTGTLAGKRDICGGSARREGSHGTAVQARAGAGNEVTAEPTAMRTAEVVSVFITRTMCNRRAVHRKREFAVTSDALHAITIARVPGLGTRWHKMRQARSRVRAQCEQLFEIGAPVRIHVSQKQYERGRRSDHRGFTSRCEK